MSDDTSNSKMLDFKDKITNFLIKRINFFGGSLTLQHVIEQNSFGMDESDILNFIEKHKDIFSLNNGIVTLENDTSTDVNSDIYNSENSLPYELLNGIGVIVKLCATFGTIKVTDPVKTSAFFSAKHFFPFGFKQQVNLFDDLNIGTMVTFNAVREKDIFNTKYYATKVWKKGEVDKENKHVHIPRNKGLYDSLTLDDEGIIIKVFPKFGFIAVNGDKNNTVYFQTHHVVNYNNIINLSEVFIEGDLIEFSAQRADRKDFRARWKAIKVWCKSQQKLAEIQSENAVSKSDLNIMKSNYPISQSQMNSDIMISDCTKYLKENTSESIYNQSGKIYPESSGAIIKFGENLSHVADGDSSAYYIFGNQVKDISWEFSKGDDVKFDGVKIKSAPGWKAIVVWKGNKPNILSSISLKDLGTFSESDKEEVAAKIYGSQLSVISTSSEKSVSSNSESMSLKKMSNYHNETHTNLICKVCKEPNLPHFYCMSQSGIPSSKDSEFSDVTNELNNQSESVINYSNIPWCDRGSVSFSENGSFTRIQEDKQTNEYDYSNFVEINGTKIKKSDHEFISSDQSDLNEDSKDVILGCNDSEKKISSKRKFQNIVGEIIKVYPTFAEIASSELPKPCVFFLKIFYFKQKSMTDMKLNDLKKVLKVGDIVYFNYFEIVDDFGQTWNKISLVWCGLKPSHFNEIAVSDFIQQLSLSVSVREPNIISLLEIPTVKLSTHFDGVNLGNKGDNCILQTDSQSDSGNDNNFCYPVFSEIPDTQEIHGANMKRNIEMLSNMISQKLLARKEFFLENKVNFNSLSSEIETLVLEQFNGKKSSGSVLNISKNPNCMNEILNKACSPSQENMLEKHCGKDMLQKCSQVGNIKTELQESLTLQHRFNVFIFSVIFFLFLQYFED